MMVGFFALRRFGRSEVWLERAAGAADYHPLELDYGSIGAFHGSLLRHYVPANPTAYTRVSLDFRVGVEGHFDPRWQLRGSKEDHSRRTATL